MNQQQNERLVVSFESIASSLAGINESARTAVAKLWPAPAGQREAIVTLAESAEEKTLKEQGALVPKGAVDQWLSEPFGAEDEEQYLGEREREFLQRQRAASAQAGPISGPEDGSVEAAQSEAGNAGESAADYSTPKDS